MASTLTHLECSRCARRHDGDGRVTLSPCCGVPLLARYDLERAKDGVTRQALSAGERSLWRYRDVLPVRAPENEITLGEGWTPLLPARRLGSALGLSRLLVKDESANPTGSFKARGLAVAVSRNRELGARAFVVPSAGNAAVAMAAYAARAGAEAAVYLPRDVPTGVRRACDAFAARVTLVDGLITDAARHAQAFAAARPGAMDLSTLREPYRAEGKKTMGYEIVEQNGWQVPDVVVYPTGGGTGIVGMWKAFAEMETLGLIGSERPRLVSVQSDGCAPIVRAFERGLDHAEPWERASTAAHGLRVPRAIADFLILRALRESRGDAIAVPDDAIARAQRDLAVLEGLDAGPESGAALAGLRALAEAGRVRRDETVVLFHTGSAAAYA